MKNSLEQFVNQHREAFDTEEPLPYKAADFIQLKKSSSFSRDRVIVLMAAASVLTVLVMTTLYSPNPPEPAPKASSHTQPPKEEIVKGLDPVAAKEVAHFSSEIETKRIQVKQIRNDHPELYEAFSRSIQQLDSVYHGLEQELAKTTNHELLLEAMIQNLRLQTGILSRQLEIIQKMKQKTKQNESQTI